MRTNTTATVTSFTIDRCAGDERWLGFGYLGERQHATDEQRQHADALLCEIANDHGWGYETLFAFVNSKRGRWYGDCLFGGYSDGQAVEQVRLWTEGL